MKTCIICGKSISGKKYCNPCKGSTMKGRHPWNYGHTATTDPRVQQNAENTGKTLKKMHAEGKLTSWIKGRTKETEPILQKVSEENAIRTRLQYLETGKDKWLEDRPGFIRTGKKNSEKQKQATRKTMLHSLFSGKIPLKRSKLEIKIKDTLIKLGIVAQEVLVEDVGIPDFFLPDYNIMLFIDGDYYHSLENVRIRDKRQTQKLKALDFIVVRWDENKAKFFNDNPENLKQALEKKAKKVN